MKQEGRIVFIEPNNSEGMIGNVSMTPDYTNYSVMFRLTADVVNRMGVTGVAGNVRPDDNNVAITWIESKGNDGKSNKVYFNKGSRIDDTKRTYYTTYYTDINYFNFDQENIVEGLGVDSIDIAMENFYAVSVKIKFVDVRGYSLFSAEEATHKNTKLTSNDVFGCFFTMPYPRFVLQVKGYYGKPMTYQLTCVGFSGELDANSGNFIATASFIGYDFGILSDIPLRYIIVAPTVTQDGKDYWEKHAKDDPTWKLYGDKGEEDPVLLLDVYQNIKNAVTKNKNLDFSDYRTASRFRARMDRKEQLTIIKKALLDAIDNSFNTLDETKKSQYIIRRKLDNVGDTNLFSAITDISIEKKTFENMYVSTDFGSGEKHSFYDFDAASYLDESYVKPENPDFSNAKKLIDEYNLAYSAYTLKSDIPFDGFRFDGNASTQATSNIKKSEGGVIYDAVVITATACYDLSISSIINEIDIQLSSIDEINTNTELEKSNTAGDIKEIIGFTPYINNVVRLLMCHMETFIHTIYTVSSSVYDEMAKGNRTPDILGLKKLSTDTDLSHELKVQKIGTDKSIIPPFPGIIIQDNDNENGYLYDKNGWPGNLEGYEDKWKEYFLVKGFVEASVRRTSSEYEEIQQNGEAQNDIMCASYIYFKNMWDRWLISASENEFKTENMMKRFVFSDGFYRDISNVLHINADVLMDMIENTDRYSTVYNFLKTMASSHNCMFFAYGDTLSFDVFRGDRTTEAVENIRDMFTPFPYSSVKAASSANRMVFFYANKRSESIPGGDDGYSDDNMYISDGDSLTEFTKKSFTSMDGGYLVPSFSVVAGRMDNSFFKNISVSMEVPTTTGQTARSISYMAEKHGAKRRKVAFYGQDLFPLLTKYSYICEFDMLGDVQITPLMYFQLFNMPMFRGVYMVFSVTHSMKNGEMNTHVKGMKMSKDAIPFPEEWFSDDVDTIMARNGISEDSVSYDTPVQIELNPKPKNRYAYNRNTMKDGIIEILMEYDFCYTKKQSDYGSSADCCQYGLLRTPETINDDFWQNYENVGCVLKDGITEEEVIEMAKNAYRKIYTEIGLDNVEDPLMAAQILMYYMVTEELNPIPKMLNALTKETLFTDTQNVATLSKDMCAKLNSNKDDGRTLLCQYLIYEYYNYTKGDSRYKSYRDRWFKTVNDITSMVNEKF